MQGNSDILHGAMRQPAPVLWTSLFFRPLSFRCPCILFTTGKRSMHSCIPAGLPAAVPYNSNPYTRYVPAAIKPGAGEAGGQKPLFFHVFPRGTLVRPTRCFPCIFMLGNVSFEIKHISLQYVQHLFPIK